MIIHISIPVKKPESTARYLAQLVKGKYKALNWCPGGYMVFTDDQYSTSIEVLPFNTVFMPGKAPKDTLIITSNDNKPQYDCVHFLLTLDTSYAQVLDIAKCADWRAVPKRSLDVIEMIELWVENRIMIEITLANKQHETINALNSKNYNGCNK
jgi:hypothetical protein